ncbi:MAG: hypothetical protein C4521_06280 [Actinobacteria bacterium]|nr:MAG: hypothetical protein C4521_06280 [Actinomycetota bacterium]
MRGTKPLYVAGVIVGFFAVLLLIPRVRATLVALLGETLGRAREAWEEGRKEMERREHELQLEVLSGREGVEEPESPDYIV